MKCNDLCCGEMVMVWSLTGAGEGIKYRCDKCGVEKSVETKKPAQNQQRQPSDSVPSS